MAKFITIELNTDATSPDCGTFKAEAFGYNGKGCDVDLAAFEKLGHVEVSKKKPEWKAVQRQGVQARA